MLTRVKGTKLDLPEHCEQSACLLDDHPALVHTLAGNLSKEVAFFYQDVRPTSCQRRLDMAPWRAAQDSAMQGVCSYFFDLRSQAVISYLLNGMVTLSSGGRITSFNRTVERLLNIFNIFGSFGYRAADRLTK
jgi:hypothetical protein